MCPGTHTHSCMGTEALTPEGTQHLLLTSPQGSQLPRCSPLARAQGGERTARVRDGLRPLLLARQKDREKATGGAEVCPPPAQLCAAGISPGLLAQWVAAGSRYNLFLQHLSPVLGASVLSPFVPVHQLAGGQAQHPPVWEPWIQEGQTPGGALGRSRPLPAGFQALGLGLP